MWLKPDRLADDLIGVSVTPKGERALWTITDVQAELGWLMVENPLGHRFKMTVAQFNQKFGTKE